MARFAGFTGRTEDLTCEVACKGRAEALAIDYSNKLLGARILIVEDEPLLALELTEELEGVGAMPLGPVASVTEALCFIASGERIDGALVNVYLRGELSFPVAAELTKRRICLLFVTGNDTFVRQHYPDTPVHPKPSDMPKLIQELSLHLAEHDQSDRQATVEAS